MASRLVHFHFLTAIFGISTGFLLTTGRADGVEPKYCQGFKMNHVPNMTHEHNGAGDADMNKLVSGTTYDAVTIEFDFIPNGKSMEFQFVFGSEEYTEFQGNGYNDGFGFFLSGPNVPPDLDVNNQPKYANGAKNLALIGGIPVNVNSINSTTNSSLYNDYVDSWTANGGAGLGCGGPSFPNNLHQMDGFTDVLTASFNNFICNGTTVYRLKMVLADAGDAKFDSWVLFKAGSFSSNFTIGQLQPLPPLCEGSQVNISITGNSNYSYLWSNNATGQSTTYNATAGLNSISVTATNADGCTITRSIDVQVHTNQNQAPVCGQLYDDGGIPVNPLVVKSGQLFCRDIPFYDPQGNETVRLFPNNLPSGMTYLPLNNNANPATSRLCWQPGPADVGVHCFTVKATDNNACGTFESECQYCIKVLCPECDDKDVVYENRSVAVNNPLPAKTKAGRSILAGRDVNPATPNGDVVVSPTEDVTFKAGEYITLKDGFTVEFNGEFLAKIDPNTCLTSEDCNCCTGWNGFNLQFPNVITPNNDGFNDYWRVTDLNHPGTGCLRNASCFDIEIYDRHGVLIYKKVFTAPINPFDCCPVKNVLNWNLYNPPFYSFEDVLYWAGTNQAGNRVPDETYYYLLKLCSQCGGEFTYTGTIEVLGGEGSPAMPGIDSVYAWYNLANAKNEMIVYPNPAKDEFFVYLIGEKGNYSLTVIDMMGKPIKRLSVNANEKQWVSMQLMPAGIYYVKTEIAGQNLIRKIVLTK